MGAGRKGPVISVEILDHLGALKRQPTDTAGENDHRCQKRSKRRCPLSYRNLDLLGRWAGQAGLAEVGEGYAAQQHGV
jgi:hypothetical protein